MFSLHTISLNLKDLLVGTQKSQLVSTASAFPGPGSALFFCNGHGAQIHSKKFVGELGKGREDEKCVTGVKGLLQ